MLHFTLLWLQFYSLCVVDGRPVFWVYTRGHLVVLQQSSLSIPACFVSDPNHEPRTTLFLQTNQKPCCIGGALAMRRLCHFDVYSQTCATSLSRTVRNSRGIESGARTASRAFLYFRCHGRQAVALQVTLLQIIFASNLSCFQLSCVVCGSAR